MEQIEEFDSTSSSSGSSSESSSNESSDEEGNGESSCEAGESDVNDSQEDESGGRGLTMGEQGKAGLDVSGGPVSGGTGLYQQQSDDDEEEYDDEGGRRRKRLRKRKPTGLRKKLRTHIESVEEFNPEARSAQSAELERLRRLQLQQSLTSEAANVEPTASQLLIHPSAFSGLMRPQIPVTVSVDQAQTQPIFMSQLLQQPSLAMQQSALQVAGQTSQTGTAGVKCHSDSSSPEVLMVDLTHTAKMGEERGRAEDAIVIDSSGSDLDIINDQGHTPQNVTVKQQSGPTADVTVVPTTQYESTSVASELLNMKYGEIMPSPDGRVLVNVGHDSSEEDVYLAPQMARMVKPHQVQLYGAGLFVYSVGVVV